MTASPLTGTAQELFHVEFNAEASETIVLIHGLFTSHLEFAEVVPHLQGYHLLLVDANGHSGSADIKPATVQASAGNVASLIGRRAHGGTAHVVGMSMGGFVTLDLSRRYPELVKSAFVTGAAPLEGVMKWMAANPTILWLMMAASGFCILGSVQKWLIRRKGVRLDDELYATIKKNQTWDITRDAFSSFALVGWEDLRAVNVPTLMVAGSLEDHVERTKRAGLLLKESGTGRSKAVEVKNAVHAWDL